MLLSLAQRQTSDRKPPLVLHPGPFLAVRKLQKKRASRRIAKLGYLAKVEKRRKKISFELKRKERIILAGSAGLQRTLPLPSPLRSLGDPAHTKTPGLCWKDEAKGSMKPTIWRITPGFSRRVAEFKVWKQASVPQFVSEGFQHTVQKLFAVRVSNLVSKRMP